MTTDESRSLDSSTELAFVAARAADDKQGTDTIVLGVGQVLTITELFVVTGAANRRLVRAIADEIEERVRESCGRSPGRTEGHREQQWVLLDYGDVVVHVFLEEMRQFYEIERLYKDAPRLDWCTPASD
ncbi:MAG: ribosome silencing factor [Ilumatobacteraceae bacterium]